MEAGRRLTTNALILVFLRLARPVLGMVLVVTISRLLGPEEFGRYTLALSFLFMFNEVAPLGLSAWIAREGARQRQRLEPLLANALSLVALAGLVLAGVMTAAAYLLLNYDPSTTAAIALLSVAIVPAAVNSLFEGVFVARERMGCIALTALAENLFKVGGAVVLLMAGYGLQAVLIVIVSSYLVATLVSIGLLHRLGIRVRCGWGAAALREVRSVAPTFLLISIFAAVSWRIGILLLGHMRSVEAVGQYGAAWRLLELALVFPQSLCMAFYPRIAAAGDDRATIGLLGETAVRYLAAGSIPVAIVLTLLSRPILELLYGESYAGASTTLAVLIWTVVPYAWVRFNAYVLVAADRQRIDLAFNAAMAVLNIALNVILIPRYGSLGTAIAMLATMTAHFLLQHAYLRLYLAGRAAPLRWDPAVAAAAVVLASCLYVLRTTNVLSACAVGATAYTLMLFYGGFFQRSSLSWAMLTVRSPRH